MPDTNNLREERFILADGFRGFSPSGLGGDGRAYQFTS
jgi:hypothetical protein